MSTGVTADKNKSILAVQVLTSFVRTLDNAQRHCRVNSKHKHVKDVASSLLTGPCVYIQQLEIGAIQSQAEWTGLVRQSNFHCLRQPPNVSVMSALHSSHTPPSVSIIPPINCNWSAFATVIILCDLLAGLCLHLGSLMLLFLFRFCEPDQLLTALVHPDCSVVEAELLNRQVQGWCSCGESKGRLRKAQVHIPMRFASATTASPSSASPSTASPSIASSVSYGR